MWKWLRENAAQWLWLIISVVCLSIAAAYSLNKILLHLLGLQINPIGYRVLLGVIFLFLGVLVVMFRPIALRLSWFVFGLVLVGVWVFNIGTPNKTWMGWTGLLVIILVIYFALEGMELAVTELRDKDYGQFANKEIAEAITEINQKRPVFYDTREWLIVLLVVFLTINSDFANIALPFVGSLDNQPYVHTVFSLMFTTFLIVWVCQSPSKQLAIRNSEAFLSLCQFTLVWRVIRSLGTVMNQIQLHSPSEKIEQLFLKSKRFRHPRNLRPSDEAYFMYGLRVHGYSLYHLEEHLIIHPDGSASFDQRGLWYVISDERKEFGRWYTFDSPFKETGKNTWAYFAPMVGETFTDDLACGLNKILNKEDPGVGFRKCDQRPWFKFESSHATALGTPQQITGTATQPLKHRFRRDYTLRSAVNLVGDDPLGAALAIAFEISFKAEKGGFEIPTAPNVKATDYLHKEVNFPLRTFAFQAELRGAPVAWRFAQLAGTATVQGAKNQSESEKMKIDAHETHRFVRAISYPLTGAQYDWQWEIWPD